MARERLAEAGVLDRVRLVAGDFYRNELPGGHDLALLSAIIHQNSPEENVDLFRKVFHALVSGGRIVIRDHVMEPDRTEPKDGAIFAVNMLVNTEGGSTYTYEEIRSWLEEAGFVNVRYLKSGRAHGCTGRGVQAVTGFEKLRGPFALVPVARTSLLGSGVHLNLEESDNLKPFTLSPIAIFSLICLVHIVRLVVWPRHHGRRMGGSPLGQRARRHRDGRTRIHALEGDALIP